MKNKLTLIVITLFSVVLMAGFVDLNYLFNYENQTVFDL